MSPNYIPGTETIFVRINGVPWYGDADTNLPILKVAYIHEVWWNNSRRWVYMLMKEGDKVEVWADVTDTAEFLDWFYELMKIGMYERRYTELPDAQIWEDELTFAN